MATKPTREQNRACDQLSQALRLIADAARLDSRTAIDRLDLVDLVNRMARASTAFDVDTIVLRAIEARGHDLGLRAGTAELLSLIETDAEPIASLLLSDDDFRAIVAKAEAELGDV